jgi:phosphoglycolate phosphatase-like HAD superfamily hydrolase
MELDAYNFDSMFSIVLGLGETQDICKPEPDGILLVLKTLGFSPDKAVYIGDSTVDLIAAKRAHVTGLLLDRTRKKHIDTPELVESDFVRVGCFEELVVFLS